jgi:hypothetical protein
MLRYGVIPRPTNQHATYIDKRLSYQRFFQPSMYLYMIISAITSSSSSASVNPVRSLSILKKLTKPNYTLWHAQVRTRAIHSTKLLSFLYMCYQGATNQNYPERALIEKGSMYILWSMKIGKAESKQSRVGMKTVGNGIYSVISFFFDCE